ncbi:kinase-like domain-containing protein [Trametes meyenii]|nr:kinase-like domain-containing protein [Trametes meyenii]
MASLSPDKLPSYVFLPPEFAQWNAEQTRKGLYGLLTSEIAWRDRYDFLYRRGYKLRPRYHPEWKPSWMGTNVSPEFCEDSIRPRHFHVIDATRISDGTRVAIKTIKKEGQELSVSLLVASLGGSNNHCVSALEALDDPLDSRRSLLVMPYLRPYNNPQLSTVVDVISFVSQMLQGLAFLHRNRIAHRDIAPQNIMMDGSPLYPDGHHPMRIGRAPDAIHDAYTVPRSEHPVKYYYVDFGLSVHFSLGVSSLVIGKVGRDMEIPELSNTVSYDAYKADVYALGNLFDKEFLQLYHNVEFLRPLIECMKQQDPALRPPAEELVKMFQQVRALVPENDIRWRLVQRSEQPYEKFINDTVAVAREGLGNLKRMVG